MPYCKWDLTEYLRGHRAKLPSTNPGLKKITDKLKICLKDPAKCKLLNINLFNIN